MQGFSAAQGLAAPHGASDAELLAALARKDGDAFSRLMQRHYPMVYRVAWRLRASEAEDVAQETFLKLWRDPSQVREASALRGWLAKVAGNLMMDRFRKSQSVEELDQAEAVADSRALADDDLARRQAGASVDAAIAELPERQRLALTLVHFEQFSNAAAADAMDLSVDGLESLLARARRSLKEKLLTQRESLLACLSPERA